MFLYYRSACHFQLKNYRECLTDIDLALEAGYPIQMCNKLYIRQCKCLLGSDFVLKIFSQSSHIFSHKRNWHNNKSQKLNNLHNFNSWMTITPILPSYKWLFLHKFFNCSAFGCSYFCVSFSHKRKSERIERKFKTQNPNPRTFPNSRGTSGFRQGYRCNRQIRSISCKLSENSWLAEIWFLRSLPPWKESFYEL